MDDPGFAQGKYASLYTNRRELLDDIAIAKDMAYGFGSTPPVELAEVYGWTSREHQDAELKKQQRQRILASEQAAQDLPWEDPEWYRGIARRYDLKVRISDNPDIRIAGPDELPANTNPEMLPIAFAHEGSGRNMHGPIIRVLPQQIRGMTREEVENVLAHEMLHTVMDSGTGHGPAFMEEADRRNIGVTGSTREVRRIEDADPLTAFDERPRPGAVLVHPAQGHRLHIDAVSGNDPRNFKRPNYRLLSQPGEEELWTGKWEKGLSLNDGVPGYYLPGSALSRHWEAFDRRPNYWEIGTVQPDGTVRWDCLTYVEPSGAALEEYARDGYCPPELEESEIHPNEKQRRDLIKFGDSVEYHYRNSPQGEWIARTADRIVQDSTLTFYERRDLIQWLSGLDQTEIARVASEKGNRGLATYTRRVNRERDRVIAKRDPIVVDKLREDAEKRSERRLAAPERPQLVGKGAPLRLPIAYDTADIPEERLESLRGAIDDYQESRTAEADVDVGYSDRDRGEEYRGMPKQATYAPKRGRGKMRY